MSGSFFTPRMSCVAQISRACLPTCIIAHPVFFQKYNYFFHRRRTGIPLKFLLLLSRRFAFAVFHVYNNG
ncbi:hypothetical protein HMPREF3293_03006 [Christensenella minuta]|uniref:Uncharacterized protein n=1 Tax=Christensenella minuta TaxID=626937 RepID=A0A136Q0X4_9FIRM|nr:hypothetical protein HMPREF3293_03006 [Christensenella minuta]